MKTALENIALGLAAVTAPAEMGCRVAVRDILDGYRLTVRFLPAVVSKELQSAQQYGPCLRCDGSWTLTLNHLANVNVPAI